MGAPLDLSNQRYGRLLVEKRAPNKTMPNGDSRRAWFCKCDCGKTIVATTMDLRAGDVNSCGCLKHERDVEFGTVHRDHGTHLHNVWCAMRQRCNYVKGKHYPHYGGRGIKVCKNWDENFLEFKTWAVENGYAPSLTLDRIDVNGDYTPENCRWVTMKIQANNRTNSRYISFNEETHTIQEWAEIINIPYSTLYMRLRNGWSVERALSN